MKFVIEPNPADYRQFLMHFDVPVEGLLPRLLDYHEKEDIHDKNPAVMVRYHIGIPKKVIEGAEIIRPVSRYCLAIAVGKAFLVQDVISTIIKHLEIIVDEEEWVKWMLMMEVEKKAVESSLKINEAVNTPKLEEKNSRHNRKDPKTGKFIQNRKVTSNAKKSSTNPKAASRRKDP